MSVHISSAAWKETATSGSERLLLLALADMANDEGVCWPSVPTLRARVNLGSDRAVQNAMASLVRRGYIQKTERDGRSNWYTVNISAFQTAQRGEAHFTGGVKPTSPRTVIEPYIEPSREAAAPFMESASVQPPEPKPIEQPISLELVPPAAAPIKSARTKKAKPEELTDGEWLAVIAAKPEYAHIGIDCEYRKMRAWCESHKESPTRRRFVAWLARIEKPMVAPSNPAVMVSAAPAILTNQLMRNLARRAAQGGTL